MPFASAHLDGEVAETVVSELRLSPSTAMSPIDQLVDYFEQRRTLLVLDNCEHLLAGCRQLVAELLARTPSLHILTTSREPLRIAGE